jgi:ATP-binding cassette subfamily B protein
MLLLGEYRAKYGLVTLCAAAAAGAEAMLHPLLMKAIFDAVSLRADFGSFVYLVVL